MRATARKAAVAFAGAALAISTLAGCGDDDDSGASAPDNASKEDFCETFSSFFTDLMSEAMSGDPSDAVDAIKDWADDMQETGLPADAPDDVRDGFEVFIDAARDLPDDATMDDLDNLGNDLSEDDQAAGDTFGEWATETCPDAMPGMSDLPTELPSDLPSDLESMMSELPTDLDPSELESMMSELTASLDAG